MHVGACALLLLLLGLLQGTATAATYYVCSCASGADAQCIAGNDNGPGNTSAKPWRSYDRAQQAFAGLAAGDSIRFCRGGVFAVGAANGWVNHQCTAAQPCTVGAYTPAWASGVEARPQIRQSNGHAFSLTSTSENTSEERGYVFSDLHLRCSACSGEAYGVLLYNDVDDVLLQRLRVSGFSIGVYLAGSLPCQTDPDCDAKNERVSLVDSEIVDNINFGWLGSGNDMLIADSRFSRNGAGGVFGHNI
jgi:hypothetical protein